MLTEIETIINALITHYSHWLNKHPFTWSQQWQGLEGVRTHLAGEAELLVVAADVFDDGGEHPSQGFLPGTIKDSLLRQDFNGDLTDQLMERGI